MQCRLKKLLGRYEHAFRSFLALHSPELNASHNAKIFVWRSRNFFRSMRRNFFSETSLICSEVKRASRWSKLISRYNGSCDFPAARRFSPRCQPSMSLFVLIDFMKTLHDDGGHVWPVIQFLPTYCMKSNAINYDNRKLRSTSVLYLVVLVVPLV